MRSQRRNAASALGLLRSPWRASIANTALSGEVDVIQGQKTLGLERYVCDFRGVVRSRSFSNLSSAHVSYMARPKTVLIGQTEHAVHVPCRSSRDASSPAIT